MSRRIDFVLAPLLLSACSSACGGVNAAAPAEPVDAPASVASPGAAATPAPAVSLATPAVPPSNKTLAASNPGSAEIAFAKQLATLLVGHATFDGRYVIGIRAIDKCHTAVTTAASEVIVDWTKAGNLASSDASERETTQLPSADGDHAMAVMQGVFPEPVGNAANRSTGAFGQLALECGS